MHHVSVHGASDVYARSGDAVCFHFVQFLEVLDVSLGFPIASLTRTGHRIKTSGGPTSKIVASRLGLDLSPSIFFTARWVGPIVAIGGNLVSCVEYRAMRLSRGTMGWHPEHSVGIEHVVKE